MILAIDAGNTHIVMGCMEGTKLRHVSRLKSDPNRTDSEYAVLMQQILSFDGVDSAGIEGAIISSVVPPLTPILRSAVKLLTGQTALIIGAGIKTGLNIKIDNPAQLGSDIVIASVAALDVCKPPVIIIDMGTATTVTVIDGGMHLRGGAILPGARLSLDALSAGTSQLPHIPLEQPKSCIGTNTIDCMKSGAVFGAAGAIDALIERAESELGEQASLIATGEIAPIVIPACRRTITYDGELLLRGLAIIYAKNKK